jgi:hypothetical protein
MQDAINQCCGQVPPPDFDEATAFLRALDPDPAAQFDFRTIDDRGGDPRKSVRARGTLDHGIRLHCDPAKNGKQCRPGKLLEFMQGLGASVFAVINETDGAGQRQQNVRRIRAQFVDADSAAAVERLRKFIDATNLMPTVLVASGGLDDRVEKLHAYWRMAGCPVAEFRAAQVALVSRIGTDPAVVDSGRTMRLPGYWHLKREPRRTHILSVADVTYDFGDFSDRVQVQPMCPDPGESRGEGGQAAGLTSRLASRTNFQFRATQRLNRLFENHNGLVMPAVRELVHEVGAEGTDRHNTLVAISGRLVYQRWNDNRVLEFLVPIVNEHFADGDWTAEIVAALRHARGREAARLSTMKTAMWR